MLHWELRDGILVFLPAADVRRSVVSDLILILPSRQETSPLWDILLLICFCSRKIRVARHFHGKVKMLDSVCFHRLESQRSHRWTVVIEWNNKTIKSSHLLGLERESWHKPKQSSLGKKPQNTGVCNVGENVWLLRLTCLCVCVSVRVCEVPKIWSDFKCLFCSLNQWALSLNDNMPLERCRPPVGQSVVIAKATQELAFAFNPICASGSNND